MKAITILSDTLCRHFLEPYGNTVIPLPNLRRLAEKSVVFDNHWIGSAPCMPARRDMLTGRYNFLERGWGGMEPWDNCLPHVLAKAGVHSHIETDHYHYFQGGGEFYATSFSTYQSYRGQEFDPMPCRIRPEDNLDPTLQWNKDAELRNRPRFVQDIDFPTPQTLQGSADWLRMNEGVDNYLLWVEVFDPHTPVDYPQAYDQEFSEALREAFPISALPKDAPPQQVERFYEERRKYANLLVMTDKWLGVLLDEIDRQGIWDDTMIVLTTDHGLMHGEHGFYGKNACHAWNEISHIPMLVHLPGSANAGQRRNQLTQSMDIFPTLADFFNAPYDNEIHGKSFLDIAADNAPAKREAALYGWFGKAVNVTDGNRTYFRAPASRENDPLYHYFLMPTEYHHRINVERLQQAEFGRFLPHVEVPVLRVPGITEFGVHDEVYTSRCYDLKNDYAQLEDLSGTKAEQDMTDLLVTAMRDADSPSEQFARLGLSV